MRFVVRDGATKWQVFSVPYAQRPKVTKWGCDIGA